MSRKPAKNALWHPTKIKDQSAGCCSPTLQDGRLSSAVHVKERESSQSQHNIRKVSPPSNNTGFRDGNESFRQSCRIIEVENEMLLFPGVPVSFVPTLDYGFPFLRGLEWLEGRFSR